MDEDVLVVTQPLGSATEGHVDGLLQIIAAITSVTLVTINLPDDSKIRDTTEVVDVADEGVGGSIPVAAIRFLRNQVRMCKTIRRRDEQVVLFYGSTSYLLPIAFARLLGRTVILEPRGDVPLTLRLQWEQRVPTPLARLLAGSVWLLEELGYRLADAIITYTPAMAEELDLDRFEEKLYPDGARYIDIETFSPEVPHEEREQVIGFLGRLDEEKRIRELAEAARRLPPGVTFVFAGDGDLRGWLEDELSAERAEGSVELTGWVDHDDVPDVLNRFKLLVLPSEPTEGLPTVILESMACGTPVLATPVSGVPDVVREGETGFFLRDVEPEAIATQCETILSEGDLTEISHRAREHIVDEYSFDGAVERYERMLESVCREE
jgi:glycosyltransferase involved in cell wall biosynthesis